MKLLFSLIIVAVFAVVYVQSPEPVGQAVEREQKLDDILKSKTQAEREVLKSDAVVSKTTVKQTDVTRYGVRVQIVEKPTRLTVGDRNGVAVYARVWKNGKQLGFGEDGSVDIERFKIYNPPILVADPSGDIVRRETFKLFPKDEQHVFTFREDPEAALLESIAHTALVAGKEGSKIEPGKRGNTTSTFYPAAGLNSPIDGWSWNDPTATDWSTVHDAVSGTSNNDTAAFLAPLIQAGSGDNTKGILRAFMLFDTSSIGSDTISSATISLYMLAANRADDFDSPPAWTVTKALSLAANNDVANGDFDRVDNNTGASDDITTAIAHGSITTGAYNDFSLNATGIANIDTGGISYFAYRESNYDADDVDPFAGGAGGSLVRQDASSADASGTTQDPKLVVEHSAGGGGEEEATTTPRSVYYGDGAFKGNGVIQ